MARDTKQVIELYDAFDLNELARLPGVYVAASDSDAYGPVLAMIEAGLAEDLGENIEPRGVKIQAMRVGTKSRNPAIGISREFFTTVLKDYEDWPEKWWREAVQNAVDAGASEIICEVTQNLDGTYTVSSQDNGGGMDEDILINKFLMLGATTKVGEGAAGGFGKAKELLLLPWLSWRVHTKNRIVDGQGIDYNISEGSMLRGTRIEVVMPADRATSIAAAESFIEKSYLPGVKFRIQNRSSSLPELDFDKTMRAKLQGKDLLESVPGKADIYVTKVNFDPHNMLIRVNGLYMFNRYIGTVEGKQVIVEITAPSVEILTANRDGFRDRETRRAVDDLGERITKDIRSALQVKRGLIRQKYQGSGKFRAQERQTRALDHIGPIPETIRGVTSIREEDVVELSRVVEDMANEPGSTAIPNRQLATELLGSVTFNGAHHVQEAIRQLVWEPDFYLVNEIEGFRVPKKFKPETMAPRTRKLVRTWTEFCRFVLMQLGNYRPFGVGLISAKKHWQRFSPRTRRTGFSSTRSRSSAVGRRSGRPPSSRTASGSTQQRYTSAPTWRTASTTTMSRLRRRSR